MDERAENGEDGKKQAGAVDLSALQNFDFSGNWSESSKASAGPRDRREADSDFARRDRRPPKARRHAAEASGHAVGEGTSRPPVQRDRRAAVSSAGRDGSGQSGPRREGDRGAAKPRFHERPRVPREQPFDIQIFPEEPIMVALTKAMRHSMRTYELFEIARLVLEKPDRFHLTIRFKPGADNGEQARLLYQSVPDQLPFLSEESAVDHVLRHHLATYFRTEEVEVEAPKGNFQFISRCTLTGDLLGPPNYHRYQSYLANYHQERFPHMSFDRFKSSIETVKDEEAVARWLQSMTRETRYFPLDGAEENPPPLHALDKVRHYLLERSRDKVVRAARSLRLHGSAIEGVLDKGIKPFILDYIETQKRFPLETANGLRGRLRRQNFFIFKRGSHGVSFVCSVKRKFREPGQQFSDSVQSLIQFLENNDCIHASELPKKLLGVSLPESVSAPPENVREEGAEAPTAPAPVNPADEEKLRRMTLDLRWLLSEGYVTEFSDGRLQVHPEVSPTGRPDPVHDHGGTAAIGPKSDAAGSEPAEIPEPDNTQTEPDAAVPETQTKLESTQDQQISEAEDAPHLETGKPDNLKDEAAPASAAESESPEAVEPQAPEADETQAPEESGKPARN